MTDELLPALPEPVSECYVFDEEYGHRNLDASDDYYTADQLFAYAREAIRQQWRPIDSAPMSTPMDQEWLLAYCPDDPWGVMGCVHVACRYGHSPARTVRVAGSNNDRRATHWMPKPSPPAGEVA